MHRIYTLEQYLGKVNKLREMIPNAALGTDIIVGFPTETEEEFLMTYQAMEEVRYSTAFLFAYSPRKGTPAMRWKDDIPEEIKQDRLQRLMSLQDRISREQIQAMLEQEVEVLVESRNSKDGVHLKGRTRHWQKVIFSGSDELIGTLQKVVIHSYNHQTLIGSLVTPQKT
jgi:tRNA-2-methylthio-N6-dimethylallyladenosine synthase